MKKYHKLLFIVVFVSSVISYANAKEIIITYYSDYMAEAEQLELKLSGEIIFYKYDYYTKEEINLIGQLPNNLNKEIMEMVQSVKHDQLKANYEGENILDGVYEVLIVDINNKSYKFTGLGWEDEPKELRLIINLLEKYKNFIESSEHSILQLFTHNLITAHTKSFDSINEKNESNNSKYFLFAKEMPEPIGGILAIQSKIIYPKHAMEAGIQGNVFVCAFINEKGIVDKTELIRGIGGGCDEEAIRVIKNTSFKPGKEHGKAVKVKMLIPVRFRN